MLRCWSFLHIFTTLSTGILFQIINILFHNFQHSLHDMVLTDQCLVTFTLIRALPSSLQPNNNHFIPTNLYLGSNVSVLLNDEWSIRKILNVLYRYLFMVLPVSLWLLHALNVYVICGVSYVKLKKCFMSLI